MSNFTPWASLAGGALIGLAAAWMMLAHGRIAGISGILGGLWRPRPGDIAWRGAFVVGLVSAGLVLVMLTPERFVNTIDRSPAALVVAGLLVGFGTRLGSGCTSGHGVCGLSRLSPRSLVATLGFMGAGMVVATIVTQLFGGTL